MLRAGRASPLLKRKSLMTKSPSFWPGQGVVEGACAKAAEAAVSSRAVAKARKVIGILQTGSESSRSAASQSRRFWRCREGGDSSFDGNLLWSPTLPNRNRLLPISIILLSCPNPRIRRFGRGGAKDRSLLPHAIPAGV